MRKGRERSAMWRVLGNGGPQLFARSGKSDEDEYALPGDDAAEDEESEDYGLTEDDDLGIDDEDALEGDDEEDDDEVEDDAEDEDEARQHSKGIGVRVLGRGADGAKLLERRSGRAV